MPPPTILLATANPHKVSELRSIFNTQGIPTVAFADLCFLVPVPEPVESGSTFEENATIKASAYAAATGHWALSDDSGLEVDALGGRPGVISAYFATDGAVTGLPRAERDRLNNERLLRELEGVPFDRRNARFVCVMALCPPPGEALDAAAPTPAPPAALVRGSFKGRIGLPPRVPAGADGFGYDPLFLVAPDFSRTSAELAAGEKNRLSHRAAAARLMAQRIRNMFTEA